MAVSLAPSANFPGVLISFKVGNTSYNIVVDASIKEQHTASSDTTDHQVETGVTITDHVRPKPKCFVLQGMISNAPLVKSLVVPQGNDASTQLSHQFSGVVQATQNVQIGDAKGTVVIPGTQGLQFSSEFSRVKAVHDAFVLAHASGSLLNVTTSLASYTNMAIENYDVPRDVRLGDSLRFTLALKNILMVSTQSVDVAAAVAPKSAKKNSGNKPVKADDDATKTQKRVSTLRSASR